MNEKITVPANEKQANRFEAAVPTLELLIDVLSNWNETGFGERTIVQQEELKRVWKEAKALVCRAGCWPNEEGELICQATLVEQTG